jgi:DNA-binding CsgD family transcriptional regulator
MCKESAEFQRYDQVRHGAGGPRTVPSAAVARSGSESTIKTHVSKVLAKIGARDRVHAVIITYEAGIVGTG